MAHHLKSKVPEIARPHERLNFLTLNHSGLRFIVSGKFIFLHLCHCDMSIFLIFDNVVIHKFTFTNEKFIMRQSQHYKDQLIVGFVIFLIMMNLPISYNTKTVHKRKYVLVKK